MHIQSALHFIYKQNFYNDKQKKVNEIFYQYHINLLNDLDHPALVEEWKKNIDADTYENNSNQGVKLPSKKKNVSS